MDDVYGLDEETRLLKYKFVETIGQSNTHTQVPKLNQFSTHGSNDKWTVVYTAIPMDAENPRTEHKRARYLGTVALYLFCVSSVAMPSSSSYNLENSLGALVLALGVALLKIL